MLEPMDEMYGWSHLPPVAASARDQPVVWLPVATRLPEQPFPLLQHLQLLTRGQALVTEKVIAAFKTSEWATKVGERSQPKQGKENTLNATVMV